MKFQKRHGGWGTIKAKGNNDWQGLGPFRKQQVIWFGWKVSWANQEIVYTMGGLESVLKLVISEEWQPQNCVSGALIWHLGQVGGRRGWQQRDQLGKYAALGAERTEAPILGRGAGCGRAVRLERVIPEKVKILDLTT